MCIRDSLHAAQSEALAMLAEDPLLQAPEHALLAAQVQQMSVSYTHLDVYKRQVVPS